MKTFKFIALVTCIFAGGALAHTGVQNAAVKARMASMSKMAAQMKTLGMMAKGVSVFEAEVAQDAVRKIAEHAAATPRLFKAQETDPKSEAKAEIWQQFEDFSQKAKALEDVAEGLVTKMHSENDLGPALKALGGTCKSCHKAYRL